MAQVRYLVRNVDEAVEFYSKILGFSLDQQFGPAMAILSRGDLSLWVAGPAASASRPMPNGKTPGPGGWNRFVLEVDDLVSLVQRLRREGVHFRNEIVRGPGGKQALCEDPSGNPIELFQPA
jgi:catechol 2,3-dioxygenase-like lactoylglutathione lyase family enzyme